MLSAVAAVVGLPLCVGVSILTNSYTGAFLVIATLGVAVWFWAFLRLPNVTGHVKATRSRYWSEFAAVLAIRNHRIAALFMLCVGLGVYTVIPFMAQYLELNSGIAKENFTLIFLFMGISSLASAVIAGKLTDLFGKRKVWLVAICGTMAMVLVVVNLPVVSVLIAGLVASAFMAISVARLVPTNAIMLQAANPAHRGAFTTLYNSVSLLSTSIGPLIGGAIILKNESTGKLEHYSTAGLVAVGFSCIAVVMLGFIRPQPSTVSHD